MSNGFQLVPNLTVAPASALPTTASTGVQTSFSFTETIAPVVPIISQSFIDWGDGTQSAVSPMNGNVSGSHAWAAPATYACFIAVAQYGAFAKYSFSVIVTDTNANVPVPLSNAVSADLTALRNAGWSIVPSGGDGRTKAGKVTATSPDGRQQLILSSKPPKKH